MERTEITKSLTFDSGHRVPNHRSKCRNPHGHTYKLIVCASGVINDTPGDPEEGMLKDFSFLKDLMTIKVHDVLDHGFIVYNSDGHMIPLAENMSQLGWKIIWFPYIPTAENIARWAFEQMVTEVNLTGYKLEYVEIHETPTSVAKYYGMNHATSV